MFIDPLKKIEDKLKNNSRLIAKTMKPTDPAQKNHFFSGSQNKQN